MPIDLSTDIEHLGLRIQSSRPGAPFPQDIFSAVGHPVAKLHHMWSTTYKATCKIHPRCTCMLLTVWYGDHKSLQLLYKWVSEGTVTSEQEHWAKAQELIRHGRGRGNSVIETVVD